MPWKDVSLMSQRYEFVMMAKQEQSNISELCRRFHISRKTAYKWLGRHETEGRGGLADRSRAPHNRPAKTPPEMERLVLAERGKHPAWGGRKLRTLLASKGYDPPAASTITEILRRNGRLNPAETEKHTAWRRFEREAPNDLWQMDFKGHFPLTSGGRCHPLTVVDDHSRYAVCLTACPDELGVSVKRALVATFRSYGIPHRMLMDNGSCWGSHNDAGYYTAFTAWLIRLGISISHGRIYHPQTQGKNERFNRTLQAEVLTGRAFRDIAHCQAHFDRWRPLYNLERPHEALGMLPPVSRYRPSPVQYPETLPPVEYAPGDIVRKVYTNSTIAFKGKIFRIGNAFRGQPVALRQSGEDGLLDVFFCHQRIAQIDLRTGDSICPAPASPPPPGGRRCPLPGTPKCVTYVSEHL